MTSGSLLRLLEQPHFWNQLSNLLIILLYLLGSKVKWGEVFVGVVLLTLGSFLVVPVKN